MNGLINQGNNMFKKDSTILFQGDSITDCHRNKENPAHNEQLGMGYANLLAGELLASESDKEYKIFNRGVSGHRIVDLYARWKRDCLNLKPDVLSLLIGINDIWHEFSSQNGVDAKRFDQFYRMLLDWTKEENPDIKLILCEPFALPCGHITNEWFEVLDERRAIVKQIAEDYQTVFVPFQSVFDEAMKKAPADHWAPDGVHPSIAGHKIMAEAWLKALN